MKKLIACISMGIVCMGLTACEGTGFDPTALENATRSIQEASKTIENLTASLGQMEETVQLITASMQQGVDSTNNFVEWYENDAIPENPWLNPPFTEEEVEKAIQAGTEEAAKYIRAYIDSFVDKNARYDAISEEDMEFFTEYFSDPEANRTLLSTYKNRDEYKDDEEAGSVDLECCGGFYYNNMYIIMMIKKGADAPFALSALTKEDDGSVNVYHNYWSEDNKDFNFDEAFIYEFYDKMLDSDLKAVMTIPGKGGDISLGSAFDMVGGLGNKKIDDALKMVSDKKDEIATYVQAFDGYDVYYSNLDPEAVGEFVVSQIDVTDGDFKTAEGIGIGSDIKMVRAVYGPGIVAMLSGGKKQLMYEMGKYNMLFIVDKAGKVEEMTLFMAETALGQ